MLLFSQMLRARALARGSWLCIGLDPQLERLPQGVRRDPSGMADFCLAIVAATQDVAAAFKLNFAFFEAHGSRGWEALERVRAGIPPAVPVIADAKRGDIGSTSAAYANAVFDTLACDAVTVNPYLGWDALQPFMDYRGKALFVLGKTSNPGASTFQDLCVDGSPLYLRVAREALVQKSTAEIGLVVGATYPEALRRVRDLSQSVLLLVPGVGAQGARAGETHATASNDHGENALITMSRDILYASAGSDFAEAASRAAEQAAGLMRGAG